MTKLAIVTLALTLASGLLMGYAIGVSDARAHLRCGDAWGSIEELENMARELQRMNQTEGV